MVFVAFAAKAAFAALTVLPTETTLATFFAKAAFAAFAALPAETTFATSLAKATFAAFTVFPTEAAFTAFAVFFMAAKKGLGLRGHRQRCAKRQRKHDCAFHNVSSGLQSGNIVELTGGWKGMLCYKKIPQGSIIRNLLVMFYEKGIISLRYPAMHGYFQSVQLIHR